MKFTRQKPEAVVMEITPQIAKEMLETSPGNRRIRGWYVNQLAAAMKRGEWRVTSQGIGFDIFGRLRDAHHRLNACIQSGVPFESVVVFGLRPDAYEVIDTGMRRTYADLMSIDNRIADVLRLGTSIVVGNTKPTVDQIKPVIESGLFDAAKALIEYCGATRKYFSSAPMKLAACIEIMNGGDADYVMRQYRALCMMDFDQMSQSAKALFKQCESGKAKTTETREVLARGLRVFDKDRQNVTRIQIGDPDINAAVEFVRSVLRNNINAVSEKAEQHRRRISSMKIDAEAVA